MSDRLHTLPSPHPRAPLPQAMARTLWAYPSWRSLWVGEARVFGRHAPRRWGRPFRRLGRPAALAVRRAQVEQA